MKTSVVLSLLLVSACTTGSKSANADALSYNKVRGLIAGESTEKKVRDLFGSPTRRTEENGYYIFSYDDAKNGLQRLVVNFQPEKQLVSAILWVPQEGENEYSLSLAKAGFQGANFKEVPMTSDNPHAISEEAIAYIDEKSGVTIRYDRDLKFVEAIAIYDVNTRLPAEADKRKKIPYTIGDEKSVSK